MDADPTSHRVRLWRGGSASKVLLHRVFFPRVRLHVHPGVCNGPWLLLWSREERRDCAAGGHRSFCVPVCSQSAPCNLMFFTQKMSLIICPVGQRPWWPELLVASFVRRTTYAAGWCLDFVASKHKEPTEGIFLCSPFAFFGGVEMSHRARYCCFLIGMSVRIDVVLALEGKHESFAAVLEWIAGASCRSPWFWCLYVLCCMCPVLRPPGARKTRHHDGFDQGRM